MSLVTWTFGGDATVLADYELTTTTTTIVIIISMDTVKLVVLTKEYFLGEFILAACLSGDCFRCTDRTE